MKDTIFTPRQKRREMYILLLAFIAANILNIAGIIAYGTPVKELISQMPVVLAVTLFLYGVVVAFRLVWWFFTRVYKIFNKS